MSAPPGHRAHNASMCPHPESNQQPIGTWDSTQPTPLHRPGPKWLLLGIFCKVFKVLHKLAKVVIMISLPVDLGECYVIVCAYQLNHHEKEMFSYS